MNILNPLIENIEGTVASAFVLLVLSFMFIFKKAISNLIQNRKKVDFKYKIADLSKHDVFSEIERFKSYKKVFRSYHVVDKTKTKIFNDFLRLKLESTSKHILKISNQASSSMNRADLKFLVNSCFNECNHCLENELRNNFVSKGLDVETTNVVIEKFFEIRQNAMDKYEKRLDSVFSCDFYESNFQLILAVYEMVAFELDDIVENCVRAFESVNGMFFELEYN